MFDFCISEFFIYARSFRIEEKKKNNDEMRTEIYKIFNNIMFREYLLKKTGSLDSYPK